MNPITKLDQIAERLIQKGIKRRIAVAIAQDPNTTGAIARAIEQGFVEAFMIGDRQKTVQTALDENINPDIFNIIDIPDATRAVDRAVEMVKSGQADILMKGLVGTDKFLKAVLDKKSGLLPDNAIMSYVAAVEVPKYHKLLFITDTAVIPTPDIKQKSAMLTYAVKMANSFGIDNPKVALISATEKVSATQPHTTDCATLCKMVVRKQLPQCTIDGPLDIFLACDPESVKIKGVATPINGDADILLFPTLDACNAFYKGLMLFGAGELAGLIQGTEKPVVVMSRSESPKSKYYCIALACLMG